MGESMEPRAQALLTEITEGSGSVLALSEDQF